MKNIYFAGPDVFRPNYKELCTNIRLACLSVNLNPLFPGDCDLTDPKEIFEENKVMIGKSDFVIANLNPFRGIEPDSGTVWEVACAYTLGIPVVAYMKDYCTVKERTYKHFYLGGNVDSGLLPDGMNVEDFGFPVNLMLHESIINILQGDYLAALNYVAALDKNHAH